MGKFKGKDRVKKKKNVGKAIFDPRLLDEHSKRIVEVRRIMKTREQARLSNDWGRSDALREKLQDMGVEVLDQKDGPSGWKFKDGSTKKLKAGAELPDDAKKIRNIAPSSLSSSSPKKDEEISKKKIKKEKDKKEKKSAEKDRLKATLSEVLNGGPEVESNNNTQNIQGMIVTDEEVGEGRIVKGGDRVTVHYTGKLTRNDKIFDSSVGKHPFRFRLGKGDVIRGWDLGVMGMRIGGRRKLVIPATLAYGRRGAPPAIPGNATLTFDIALLDIK